MNNIEEKLWAYIDGSASETERVEIEQLIATDGKWRQQYEELVQMNADFQNIELDEPPMAFTYNVMEGIRTQEASAPLKAGINKWVVWGIAGLFILMLTGLLAMAFGQVNWHSTGSTQIKVPASVNLNAVKDLFSGPVMKAFLFLDVVAALFLGDMWLRRRRNILPQNRAM